MYQSPRHKKNWNFHTQRRAHNLLYPIVCITKDFTNICFIVTVQLVILMVSIFLKTDFDKNTRCNRSCVVVGFRVLSVLEMFVARPMTLKGIFIYNNISSSYRNSRVLIHWLPVLCQFLCDGCNDHIWFSLCLMAYTHFRSVVWNLGLILLIFFSWFLVFLRDLHNIYFFKNSYILFIV